MIGMQKKSVPAVLIYDGECPVCRKTVTWIRENMSKDAFEMIPCQSDDARKRFPSVDQGGRQQISHSKYPLPRQKEKRQGQ